MLRDFVNLTKRIIVSAPSHTNKYSLDLSVIENPNIHWLFSHILHDAYHDYQSHLITLLHLQRHRIDHNSKWIPPI